MLGTEAVGLFAFAVGIYSQVASFLPLGNVLIPILPRYVDQRDVFARYVRSAIKAQLFFAVILIIATFVGLPLLVLIFPKYAPAVPMIMVIIFALIPSSVVSVYTPAFTALKAQFGFFWSTALKTLFLAIFTPFCILGLGTQGIGASNVLYMFTSMLERTARLKRELPEFRLSVKDFFVFDEYEKMLIAQVLRKWKLPTFSFGTESAPEEK